MSIAIKHRIAKLSPAAARLYIALYSAAPTDTWDDVVDVSGIIAYRTLVVARQQLADLGLIITGSDGRSYLSPLTPEKRPPTPLHGREG